MFGGALILLLKTCGFFVPITLVDDVTVLWLTYCVNVVSCERKARFRERNLAVFPEQKDTAAG